MFNTIKKASQALYSKSLISGVILTLSITGAQAAETSSDDKQLPAVEEVYKKFISNNGGQLNLLKMISVIVNGRINQGDQFLDFKLYRKRPDKMKIQVELNDLQLNTVFDGKNGWVEVSDAAGTLGVTKMEGERLKVMQQDSNFDSPFHVPLKSLKYITAGAFETVNGIETVRMDLDPEGGFNYTNIWISLEHYQEVKVRKLLTKEQLEKPANEGLKYEDIYYEKYKKKEGVHLAYLVKHYIGDSLNKIVEINDVVVNRGIFDYYFEVEAPED